MKQLTNFNEVKITTNESGTCKVECTYDGQPNQTVTYSNALVDLVINAFPSKDDNQICKIKLKK